MHINNLSVSCVSLVLGYLNLMGYHSEALYDCMLGFNEALYDCMFLGPFSFSSGVYGAYYIT